MGVDESVAAGHAALQTGRWDDARAAFEEALKEGPETPGALAGLGEALLWLNELESAMRSTERAYAGFRRRGELCQAARAAMWLGRQHFLMHGNATAGNGWMVRAERLLRGSDQCVERGWLEIFRRAGSSDPTVVLQAAAQATEVARQFGDNDLETVALAYSGAGLVASGQLGEGMDRLDEAMAAATAGEVRKPLGYHRDLLRRADGV